MGEFEIIERYFRPLQRPGAPAQGVVAGIGDDAAVLAAPAGRQLVAAIDTLVEGVHFPVGSPPHSIGHRALAVNLSDLAAMGAEPAWFLLALTLPAADAAWLGEMSRGLAELAARECIALVGGDTTRGPLTLSVQVLGFVEPAHALLRSGAQPGDLLFVSGTPGDAAAGLALLMNQAMSPDEQSSRVLKARFEYPAPRVALGRALRGLASACIDVSDGLAADAGRLASASGCGARIEIEQLPLSPALRRAVPEQQALRHALTGGDDYELCFTVPPGRLPELAERAAAAATPVACIGVMESTSGVRILRQGAPVALDGGGFDHFAAR